MKRSDLTVRFFLVTFALFTAFMIQLSPSWWLLLLVIPLGLLIGYYYVNSSTAHIQYIHREIERYGGRVIKIDEIFRDWDKSHRTYTVVFADDSGQRYETRCKFRDFSDAAAYWRQSPAALLGQIEQHDVLPPKQGEKSPLFNDDALDLNHWLTKEGLLDRLDSPYRYDRQWAAENIRRLDQVDEPLVQLLQDMAVSDPEPAVRNTAVETLQLLGRK